MMVDNEVPIKWSFVFHFCNDASAFRIDVMLGFAVFGKWCDTLEDFHCTVSDSSLIVDFLKSPHRKK